MSDQDEEQGPSSFARWEQRPVLGNRGLVLAVVIPLLIAAAGFGVVSLVSRNSDTTATAVRVPTSDWIPGQQVGKDLIRGTLSVDERRCVYLQGSEGRLWPIWPAGFRARLDEAGKVSLYDGKDHLVARDGEAVQASGTYASPTAFSGQTCLPSDGEVAVVQSEVTRLG